MFVNVNELYHCVHYTFLGNVELPGALWKQKISVPYGQFYVSLIYAFPPVQLLRRIQVEGEICDPSSSDLAKEDLIRRDCEVSRREPMVSSAPSGSDTTKI